MDNVDLMHKLTMLRQHLCQLVDMVDDAQVSLIKVLTEDQMRVILLRRYPLRVANTSPTAGALLEKIEDILPHVRLRCLSSVSQVFFRYFASI